MKFTQFVAKAVANVLPETGSVMIENTEIVFSNIMGQITLTDGEEMVTVITNGSLDHEGLLAMTRFCIRKAKVNVLMGDSSMLRLPNWAITALATPAMLLI